MKNRAKLGVFIAVFVAVLQPLYPRLKFDKLDLKGDKLLFRANEDGEGSSPENAVFLADISQKAIRQLSAFPETMDLINSGKVLQVRNSFGTMRVPVTGGLPQPIPGFTSFAQGAPVIGGRVELMASSGDGRWILCVEAVSAAYGNLILLDAANGSRTVVSGKIGRPGNDFPAVWSPDSRFFIYTRNGSLYFYPVNVSPVEEQYRMVGDGSIKSICWGRNGDFFYIRGSVLYHVKSSEVYARAFYTGLLEIGTIAGHLPFDYNYNFDSFWVAPDSKSIVLVRNEKNIFYYPLDAKSGTVEVSLPYLILPDSFGDIKVLWSNIGLVTVLIHCPGAEGDRFLAYRLDLTEGGERVFKTLELPYGPGASLSPDHTRVLLWGKQGLALYDYVNWKETSVLDAGQVYDAFWVGNNEIISGGASKIERIGLSGSRSLICLSQVEAFAFEDGGGRIFARSGSVWYSTDGERPWQEVNNPPLRETSTSSRSYRVYLQNSAAGPYDNIPMIRSTAGVGTVSLLPEPVAARQGFIRDTSPTEEGGVFYHGLRTGPREIAICFDMLDDEHGLPEVLRALARFNFRATFFLNGEFIRRYPEAAREIVDAGHESASMFFTSADLTDARFRVDGDFIAHGLARNEDEFYQATGAELALIWHAPYFAVSREILESAKKAGYATVGRDVDPQDWILVSDAKRLGLGQLSASDMVDRTMETKQPGSIIPIRLGVLQGGRTDYLYKQIEVLFDALVREGYTVVPVSVIMAHAH